MKINLQVLGIVVLCFCTMIYAQRDITELSSGQISAEFTDSPAGEDILKVIDNLTSTKFNTHHASAWIQFQSPAPYVVAQYTITSANDFPERDPANWTLTGSNDGAAWTTLDTRTNEVFLNRFQKNTYAFTNSTAYSYYRMNISCASGTTLQLSEWELFVSVSHDVAVTGIIVPFTKPDSAIAPQVKVTNFGSSSETFPVTCLIDSAGVRIYSNTQTVTALGQGITQTLSFPVFTPRVALYMVTAFVALTGDVMPSDDTARSTFFTGSYDITKDSMVYEIAGAHLDDQWNWTLGATISSMLPNTMTRNFAFFDQYPEYNFSFEGAFRYWLMKKFAPSQYAILKSWIAKDRWSYVGTFWDPCDVNLPSAEALIRQALYGDQFSQDEFGKRSKDIYLPDCFGFGYALPTIASHCGLLGFSTQKFDQWGGWFPTPFSIGRWIGVDGSSIVCSLKPGTYTSGMDIRIGDGNALKAKAGFWVTQDYIGTGDQGGAPSTTDVDAMITRIRANATNGIKVICAPADKLYRDLTPSMVSALPSYDGELLATIHGVGCYTSWASMKFKNRRNEQRAAAAEFSGVMGNWLTSGTFAYPGDTITAAWRRFLAQQFHDVLTGTSVPGAYDISAPAEDSAYHEFNYAFGLGNDIMANSSGQQLTTTVSATGRVPLVLVNPLAVNRCDAVEAVVTFGAAAHAGVKVYDPSGAEVPAQIIGSSGQYDTIVFIATVPSASYSVFEAEPAAAASPANPNLSIKTSLTNDTLENPFYRVVVDANGDIASVYSKKNSQELLSAPSRFELRNDPGTGSPAWEITYAAVSAAPTGYVDQTVVKTVKENGPAIVSLQMTRSKNGSTFTQVISLAADSAGARVDVDNAVNWLTTGTLLKVGFPMTCSNDSATWDLGIGVIKRPNQVSARYEVPGQQWADLSSSGGSYGLSILNNCKYGWNKESNSKLNLTLIHSPTPAGNYTQDQSNANNVGIHQFKYSLYGHTGSWTNGTIQQAARLNQPIYAYQTTSRAGTVGGKQVAFVSPSSPQVMVMAIKKAEKSNFYVIRVREAYGTSLTGAKLTFGANITQAVEMNGLEDIITSANPITASGRDLTFNLTKFQPRTFAVSLVGSPVVSIKPGLKDDNRNILAGVDVSVSLNRSGYGMKTNFRLLGDEKIQSIRIIDASGRLVRMLVKNGNCGKARTFAWDGKNDRGQELGTGVYFVCLSTNKSKKSARLMVSKTGN